MGNHFYLNLFNEVRKIRITFKNVISPSDKEYDVDKVEDILKEIEGFKEPRGKKWLVNLYKNFQV